MTTRILSLAHPSFYKVTFANFERRQTQKEHSKLVQIQNHKTANLRG